MDPTQIPLRDLHLPEAIGWWPPAPGWWVLAVLLAALIVYLLYRAYSRWRRNALRRVALRELKRIEKDYRSGVDEIALAIELSALLRRAMLAYAPRHKIAGLTGERWLHWLDQGLDDDPFSKGAGQNVESLPYRRPEVIGDDGDVDVEGLIDAVRLRLQTPLMAEAG